MSDVASVAPASCSQCGLVACCSGHSLCLACLIASTRLAMGGPPKLEIAKTCMSCKSVLKVQSGDICQDCRKEINARTKREEQEKAIADKKAKNKKPIPAKKPQSKRKDALLRTRIANRPTQAFRPTRPPSFTVCVLCGEKVAYGYMLSHKVQVHGESGEPPKLPHKHNRWVTIVSGGLPGLGKRR